MLERVNPQHRGGRMIIDRWQERALRPRNYGRM